LSDDPIKKRMARAKQKAFADLRALGYDVILSDNKPVCLVAMRGSDVRLIKICLDSPAPTDRLNVSRFKASTIASRELWIRRVNADRFEIQKI